MGLMGSQLRESAPSGPTQRQSGKKKLGLPLMPTSPPRTNPESPRLADCAAAGAARAWNARSTWQHVTRLSVYGTFGIVPIVP